jgi:hypothetical protein
MWRETELVTSPFYLLAKHQRSHVDNNWPLSKYSGSSFKSRLGDPRSLAEVFRGFPQPL